MATDVRDDQCPACGDWQRTRRTVPPEPGGSWYCPTCGTTFPPGAARRWLDLSLPMDERLGPGAGDADRPYRSGRRLTADSHVPLTDWEFDRLLVLRGRVQDGAVGADDAAADDAETREQPEEKEY